jgi:drug/metabolite transporter (DMT)-like permease
MLAPVAIIGPHPIAVSLAPVLSILVLGFAGSGIAYLLYYNLLAQVSATQVSSLKDRRRDWWLAYL